MANHLQLDPNLERVFSHMEDAIVGMGEHADLVQRLCEQLAPPPLPAHPLLRHGCLLPLQPVRRSQGEQEQGELPMGTHRPHCFLGRMAQLPLLLRFFATAVLNGPAVIVGIKGMQRLLY
jgi:hypothetical protein